jgi:hypothetical protein
VDSAAQAVSGTAPAPPGSLNVALAGSGSVFLSVPGMTCSGPCAYNYPGGTSVTLTQTATRGWIFTGWSGACSGASTCTVVIGSNQAVTANFAPARTLTTAIGGAGQGKITGAGISCPGSCIARYPSGAVVSLTATPAAGSVFKGWKGACSGFGACRVTMSSNRKAVARFAPAPHHKHGPTRPRCRLVPRGNGVWLAQPRPAQGQKAHRRVSVDTLSLTATCDRSIRVRLSGVVFEVVKRQGKLKKKQIVVRSITITLSANVPKTVHVRLPRVALRALARGKTESVRFALSAIGRGGTFAQANVRRLRIRTR